MKGDGVRRTGNLVDTSGREHASLDERVQRLKSEAVMLQAARARLTGSERWGHDSHAIGVLLGNISYLGRTSWPATSPRLSRIECDLMAFWRGGADAVHALHRQRKELTGQRDAARKARIRWLYPLLAYPVRGTGDMSNPWVDIGEAGA